MHDSSKSRQCFAHGLMLEADWAAYRSRALLKTCCSKMFVDFRDEKPAENTEILSYFEAFRRLFSRKDIWQVWTLGFLEAPSNISAIVQ
ncbi:MAG TPA: hypothetical protein DCO86_01895 [Spirochaetaceae bacterium]|nr:hypothetical protein [Spirochaetaceae bacterium]